MKKYKRRLLATGLAVVWVLGIPFGGVQAGHWEREARRAYQDHTISSEWAVPGVLPGCGPKRDAEGNLLENVEFLLEEPTDFVLVSNLSELTEAVRGKVVVVRSAAGASDSQWVQSARQVGAVAVLRNEPDTEIYYSDFRSHLSEEERAFPYLLIRPQELEYFEQNQGQKLITNRPHEAPINTYASWGLSSDFVMNPDLIAPGTVYAPFSRRDPESDPPFGVLEGTSMSTPTVAGATVLVKQYLQSLAPELKGAELARALRAQLQVTALAHRDENLQLTTPRWQGGGELDVDLATANPVLVSTPYREDDTESGLGKVNLRDSIRPEGSSPNRLDFLLQLRNLGQAPVQFTSAEVVVLVDRLGKKHLDREKLAWGESDEVQEREQKKLEAFEQLPASQVGVGSVEVARIPLATPQVAGKTQTELPVQVDLQPILQQQGGPVEAIRKASPNGFFIDGFVLLEYYNDTLKRTVELSVPFVSFYGDWLAVPVLERSIYDRKDALDVPFYGAFSSVIQEAGDHTTPHPFLYFGHFAGKIGTEDVVLGADWDYEIEKLQALKMDDTGMRVEASYIPENPSVRKDKISVSLKGNGARNVRLRAPALRNWLAARLSLVDASGKVLLTDEVGNSDQNEKQYKDHGMKGTSSGGNTADENQVKRTTEFGSLDLEQLPDLKEGEYTLRVEVRPDAFNLNNPVMQEEARQRGFDTYWQKSEYLLTVDSTPPSQVQIHQQNEAEETILQISAVDEGAGVRGYRLLDAGRNELARSADGRFVLDPAWGEIQQLYYEVSDYAYNSLSGRVEDRLDLGDTGSLVVNTICADPAFATSYHAVSLETGRTYLDLSMLPVGKYRVGLLNPMAGFGTQTWSQEVEIRKDQRSELTFAFVPDSSRSYPIDLTSDLVLSQYDERLPGIAGSSYELRLHDPDTEILYVFPQNNTAIFEIQQSIQPGKYHYSMPGLRRWKLKPGEYDAEKKNWILGIYEEDGDAYTSVTPKKNRKPAFEVVDTAQLGGKKLEYFFYLPQLDPELARPVVLDANGHPMQEYILGTERFAFELRTERPQNPEQFRVLLPARLAEDPQMQEDPEESILVDSYSHHAEMNSYARSYFVISHVEETGRSRVDIYIPPLLRSKLQEGDVLIVQETDQAGNPDTDTEVRLPVVKQGSEYSHSLSVGGRILPRLHAPKPEQEEERVASEKREQTRSVLGSESGMGISEEEATKPLARLRKVENERLNERIGHTQAWRRGYRGTGMLVAVIDNGQELDHPSFHQAAPDPEKNKIPNAQVLAERIEKARKEGPSEALTLRGRYFSDKIPYIYNYYLGSSATGDMMAGGDEAYEHGAHVAGTATANPESSDYPEDWPAFAGVAPEAQLAVLSVADSVGQKGDSVQYYSAAIYDAVALGADVITASLGYGAGTTTNVNDSIRKAVAYAQSQGVLVLFAAGNSGAFGWTELRGGESVDKINSALMNVYSHPEAENPDYGTMDAPAVYDGIVSVGAYGANLFPVVDNSWINPWIQEDGYTTGYFGAYQKHRIFLVPASSDPGVEPTPEPEPNPNPNPIPEPSLTPVPEPTVHPSTGGGDESGFIQPLFPDQPRTKNREAQGTIKREQSVAKSQSGNPKNRKTGVPATGQNQMDEWIGLCLLILALSMIGVVWKLGFLYRITAYRKR